jgi:hypothetical protein
MARPLGAPSKPAPNLRVRLMGCEQVPASSDVHIYEVANHKATFDAPLHSQDGMVFEDFKLVTGYYGLRVTGACPTVKSNPPFVVLADHVRSITIHTGSGIGVLYSGWVGLAGNAPRSGVAAILDTRAGPIRGTISSGAYYFDEVPIGVYTLQILDRRGCQVFRSGVDLSGQTLFTVRIVNAEPSTPRCGV